MSWLGRVLWQRLVDPRLTLVETEVAALKADIAMLKEQTAELMASNERPKG